MDATVSLRSAPEDEVEIGALFTEPPDFYPPTPPPTTQTFTLASGLTLSLGLVGHSPLEAHRLWTGSRVLARYFDAHRELVAGRTVLELGAGAGLPGLVAAVLGAQRAVLTDFPDADLIGNMWDNIRACEAAVVAASSSSSPEEDEKGKGRVRPLQDGVLVADGFVWGGDVAPLLALLPSSPSYRSARDVLPGAEKADGPPGFDVLILADLLFRHSEHTKLVRTITQALRRRGDARAYVFFTSYRPWLRDKDLRFFDVAREAGLVVEHLLEEKMERPMFEDDPGDEEVRRTCSGYAIRWPG